MIDFLRKQLFAAAVKLDRRSARELAFFRQHERDTPAQIQAIQQTRLSRLLQHAQSHVPYYRRLLQEAGIRPNCRLDAGSFQTIPPLTRDLVRKHFNELKSDDLAQREWYANKTGGSTGEPLSLIQEKADSKITGGAALRWFYSWHNVWPGDREVKLWGSDRDLFYGAPPLKARLHYWSAGFRMLNAFKMTPELMRAYIEQMNRFRPVLLRGYVSNLYELACFAQENQLAVIPPRAIVSSAGKLYPHMREKMEQVFGCKLFDHYGTREVHNVAIECEHQDGLHYNAFTHVVEVLDETGYPCAPGVEGRIVITTLLNQAMPLIRYDIGDRGVLAAAPCACGRGLPRLQSVSGRSTDCFRTRAGRIIPGEFFIYLLVVAIKDSPFLKVQAVQEDYDSVRINVVLRPGCQLNETLCREITSKTRTVMGENCNVEFTALDEILTSPSGKYRYTICKLLTPSGSPATRT